MTARRWFRAAGAAILSGTVSACVSAHIAAPRVPYGADDSAIAGIAGIPGARAYADAPAETFRAMMTGARPKDGAFAYLALSGGGGDGAYGAGLLNGWTASGHRPVFGLVSGVSTGALTAPFAFLGSAYDPVLTEIYTSGIAATLVTGPSVANVLFGSGLFGDERLRDLVGRYVTPDLLAAIATEHRRGRRLLIVTTNLDAKRAMIWNMGVIAASGAPNAAALFRDVLTASTSVPAVFPPQRLDVEAGGRRFQELHVDGAVVTPVFTVPQAALVRDGRLRPARGRTDIYVLMNGRIEPDFEVVEPSTLSIIRQTVAAGSQARSRATLAATYAFARANHIGFHLAAIDETAPRTTVATGFDTDYMRRLYRAGHAKARAGSAWRGDIPGTPLVPTISVPTISVRTNSVRTNSVRTNSVRTNLAPTILAAAAGDGDGTTKPD